MSGSSGTTCGAARRDASGPGDVAADSGRRRRVRAGLIAAAAIVAVGLGCSVEKHYRILSFFFDGVPDPAVLAASRSEVERVRAAGGIIYTHEPYGKEQCDTCHRTPAGRMLTKVTASVCMNCHGDVVEQHRFMHGPVAVSACLWCHSPHESTEKSLLRIDANTLCRQCHDAAFSARRNIPGHADLTRSCLDCHSGHGGSERYFLHLDQMSAPRGSAGGEGELSPGEDSP